MVIFTSRLIRNDRHQGKLVVFVYGVMKTCPVMSIHACKMAFHFRTWGPDNCSPGRTQEHRENDRSCFATILYHRLSVRLTVIYPWAPAIEHLSRLHIRRCRGVCVRVFQGGLPVVARLAVRDGFSRCGFAVRWSRRLSSRHELESLIHETGRVRWSL